MDSQQPSLNPPLEGSHSQCPSNLAPIHNYINYMHTQCQIDVCVQATRGGLRVAHASLESHLTNFLNKIATSRTR